MAAKKAAAKPTKPTVVSAVYHGVDVTEPVTELVGQGRTDALCVPDTFGIDDPAPGVPKSLDVQFRRGQGKAREVSFVDGDLIRLPS